MNYFRSLMEGNPLERIRQGKKCPRGKIRKSGGAIRILVADEQGSPFNSNYKAPLIFDWARIIQFAAGRPLLRNEGKNWGRQTKGGAILKYSAFIPFRLFVTLFPPTQYARPQPSLLLSALLCLPSLNFSYCYN